ncbi:helix-turn-helix domain-containing protein [Lachnospiraceae bacterium]|nr:helix-turn-helix domain-containing protein [Lachnospiraceae bacterium]
MKYYTIGNLIRDARERQNCSQEEVCHGICTSSTLSRIENGQQAPGKKILEGLMQRLGIVEWFYDISMSRQEEEKCELERRLARCFERKEYDKVQMLADELEEKLKTYADRECNRRMEQQYLYFVRIMIRKERGENLEKTAEQLLEVIRMTLPDFDGMHIQTRLLNYQEISILNSIGSVYYALGKSWDALRLMFDLKEYLENHMLNSQKISEKYPMVLQNLSLWMEREGHYKDALELCQKGIDFCIEYGKMHTFPMLLCNKACALAELGQIEMSKEVFEQSTAIFQAVGQRESAELVKEYARYYGI